VEHVSDLLSSFSFSPARAIEIDRREVGRSRADKLVEFCGDGCAVSIASSERRNTISGALKQRKGRPRGPNHIHPGLYASKNSYKKMKDPGCDRSGSSAGARRGRSARGIVPVGSATLRGSICSQEGSCRGPAPPRLMSHQEVKGRRTPMLGTIRSGSTFRGGGFRTRRVH